MGDIRFRSKKDGQVKFTASQKGVINVVGKDGKRQSIEHIDTGKSETVKVRRGDYQEKK